SGDAHEDIASLSQCLNLAHKNTLVSIIVADCGQDRTIRRQCDSAQRRTIFHQATHKLSREMLRVSCAAAVTGNHELAASLQSMSGRSCCVGQHIMQSRVLRDHLQHSTALIELFTHETGYSAPDRIFHACMALHLSTHRPYPLSSFET